MTNGWMLNGEWTCAVCGDVDGAHHDNCATVASCRNGGNDTLRETCKKCGAGLVYGEVDGDLCTDCEFVALKAEIAALKAEVERLRESECGKCGRSLAPDGDCHGCRADRLEADARASGERY